MVYYSYTHEDEGGGLLNELLIISYRNLTLAPIYIYVYICIYISTCAIYDDMYIDIRIKYIILFIYMRIRGGYTERITGP
jgi:hypothetical protein